MRERFNTVAVAIPAQQFHVRCHVSIDRQVPVMTDFAVRLLHLSGPLEVGALRAYFGLSASELIDLVDILRVEGLVTDASGRLELTAYAQARFQTSADGHPRFTRIAERQSSPIFELLTYTPLPRSLTGSLFSNFLQLKWESQEQSDGKTVDLAQEAFHNNFHEIERLEVEDERRRAYSCYKIDSTRAGRPFSIPLPVHFEVDIEGNVEFEVDSALELLPESLRSQVRMLTADSIGASTAQSDHLAAFVEYFEDELLGRHLAVAGARPEVSSVVNTDGRLSFRKEPSLNFTEYIREAHGAAGCEVYDDGRSKALLGALYMPENQDSLGKELHRTLTDFKRHVPKQATHPLTLFWVTPDSELWGRTDLVRLLLERVRRVVDEVLGVQLKVVAVAPSRRNEHRDRQYKRASNLASLGFDQVNFAHYRPTYERFEALLLPGVFGAGMYQWTGPTMNRFSVPLGFQTDSPGKLQRLARYVLDALISSEQCARRGSAQDVGGRGLKLEQATASEFLYLDAYAGSVGNT